MIKQNIKFLTTGQFLTFSHTCKNLSSDVRIQDLENHNRVDINGKDLSELATIQLGLPFLLVIHGEDEKNGQKNVEEVLCIKIELPFTLCISSNSTLITLPRLLLQFLSQVLTLPIVPLLSVCFRFHRKRTHTVD